MANVEHSVLTGSDLHESKGVAAAANNRVFVTNGAGSGSFQQVPAAAIAAAGVLVFQSQFYHIRDERSSGTNGDVLTDATWNTRALNTEVTDDLGITTSSNQMSLVAGTYYIEVNTVTNFTAVANVVTATWFNKLRLRNVTDSTTLINGVTGRFQVNNATNTNNIDINIPASLSGRFTLAGTKSVEVQNWTDIDGGSPTIRSGKPATTGENEIYTDVRLWKTA